MSDSENNGWVKNYRKIKQWQWYQIPNMAHLFQHLIREANHKPLFFKGIKIERGQLATGRKSLSLETGIAEQSIRTCLNKLKSTNEITIKTTKHFSIITICNYECYQADNQIDNQQINQQLRHKLTSYQPATNQLLTTNKNNKNNNNNINTHTHTIGISKNFTLQEVKDLAFAIGIPDDKAEDFYHHFNQQGWKRSNGLQMTDLKSALIYWRNNQFRFEVKNDRTRIFETKRTTQEKTKGFAGQVSAYGEKIVV